MTSMHNHFDAIDKASRALDALPPKKLNGHSLPEEEPINLWNVKILPPRLARGILPAVIDDLAFSRAGSMDPAAIGVAALSIAAMAGSASIQASVNGQWKETFRLWYALCGSASAKKSPHIGMAAAPLKHANANKAEEYEREMKAWRKRTKNGKEESDDDPRPVRTVYITEDATIEGIGESLKHHAHGVGLVHDEISALLAKMENPYQRGSGAPRGDWLKLYDGGPHGTMRAMAERNIYVAEHSASLLGGITLDALVKLANQPGAGDGLLARLSILLMPPAPITQSNEPTPPAIQNRYNHAINRMIATRPFERKVIPLEEEARGIHLAAQQEWEGQVHLFEESMPRYAERLGKLSGLAVRVALGFALLDAAAEESDGRVARAIELPPSITWQVMGRACDFVNFQASHDLSFYELATHGETLPELKTAQLIASWILRKKITSFQAGDLARSVYEWRNKPARDRRAALTILEDSFWISPEESERGVRWQVTPRAHTLFADLAAIERRRAEQVAAVIIESATARRDEQEEAPKQ